MAVDETLGDQGAARVDLLAAADRLLGDRGDPVTVDTDPPAALPAALTVVLAEEGRPVYVAKNILDLGTFDLVVDELGPPPEK